VNVDELYQCVNGTAKLGRCVPSPPNGPYVPQAELEGMRQDVLIPETRFIVGRMSSQSILWGSSPTSCSGRDRFGWRSLIG
jgi:hypothetical protein